MTLRVERAEDYYTDESGERFQQLFRDAEVKRVQRRRGFATAGFWFVVFSLAWGLLAIAVTR